MTLSPWPVGHLDSAAGSNTIGDVVRRRVQTFAVRESAAARLRWIANYHNRKDC